MNRRAITDETEQAVCSDIKAGISRLEIMEKHGITKTMFYEIKKQYGLHSKYRTHGSDEAMDQARAEVLQMEAEEDQWKEEFRKQWDAITKPVRQMRYRRERKKGVYW